MNSPLSYFGDDCLEKCSKKRIKKQPLFYYQSNGLRISAIITHQKLSAIDQILIWFYFHTYKRLQCAGAVTNEEYRFWKKK